jgi:5-methylcytosine-specific restriction endonuclease McrA
VGEALILGRALVLNATYEPLCVVSARRALVLVLKHKAELVHQDGGVYRSERMTVPIPSVIRLKYFVRVPYRARASLSRRAVFVRDSFQCQYCGTTAENVDHVIPRSRGGTHTWDNVVAACRGCNTRKENKLPKEAGMKLRSRPAAPREKVWIIVAVGRVDPKWEPYLNGHRPAPVPEPAAT